MYYEINVSKGVRHFFATHQRSLTNRDDAKAVYDKLREAFPESEGWEVRCTRYDTSGTRIHFDANLAEEE